MHDACKSPFSNRCPLTPSLVLCNQEDRLLQSMSQLASAIDKIGSTDLLKAT